MKVKIIREVPVQKQFRPTVVEIYDVVEHGKFDLVFVDVNGTKVGVYLGREAEIIKF